MSSLLFVYAYYSLLGTRGHYLQYSAPPVSDYDLRRKPSSTPRVRIELLSSFPEPGPQGWCPSWEQLSRKPFIPPVTGVAIPYYTPEECLKYDQDSDTYFNSVYYVVEDTLITPTQTEPELELTGYKIQLPHLVEHKA